MPVPDVLLIVEVFTPLNEVVDLIIEVLIFKLEEAFVVEGVLIELLQSVLIYIACNLRLLLN